MDEEDEPSCLALVGNFLRRMGSRTRHYVRRTFRAERTGSFEIAVLEPRVYGPVQRPGTPFAHLSQPLTDGDEGAAAAQRQLIDWRPPTPPPLPTPHHHTSGARKRLRMPNASCDLDTLRHALDDVMQQKVQNDENEKNDFEEDKSSLTGIIFDEDIEPEVKVYEKES